MSTHSAVDTALGFRYQELYALLLLWRESSDDAQVFLETLDDVVLIDDGQTLLEQLKHSLADKPTPLTIKSVPLWKTLKVWIDVLPEIDLTQTKFNLVSVADIASETLLDVLLEDSSDRSDLIAALEHESKRVQSERLVAKSAGVAKLPHNDRAPGCEAFLKLSKEEKVNLFERIRLKPGEKNIRNIEQTLADSQTSVIPRYRATVAQRLVEWWDRQVIYSMCGMRDKGITRFEVIQKHMEIVSDLALDQLPSPFETSSPPKSYQPSRMIEQQITLVGGSNNDLIRATREEWRARETRSLWSTENPARYDQINRYDDRLTEEWSDRHTDICNSSNGETEESQCEKGLDMLRWTHFNAPKDLEAISAAVIAPYYVRGSYQVLSIEGRVGWHPEYRKLLGFEE